MPEEMPLTEDEERETLVALLLADVCVYWGVGPLCRQGVYIGVGYTPDINPCRTCHKYLPWKVQRN